MVTDILTEKDDLIKLIDFGELPVPGYLCDSYDEALMQPKVKNSLAISRESNLIQQASRDGRLILSEKVYSNYQSTYSSSKRLSNYMQKFLDYIIDKYEMVNDDCILEIGSNNGHIVKNIASRGFNAFGVDPSSPDEIGNNFHLMKGYWGTAFVKDNNFLNKFKCIFARHTFEHVYSPLDFLNGASGAIRDDGLLVIEVPYIKSQIHRNHFEGMSVQHETFFSITSMKKALRDSGFFIVDLGFVPLDGGSMVVFAKKNGLNLHLIDNYLNLEEKLGYNDGSCLVKWHEEFLHLRENFISYIAQLKNDGKLIIGYGAGSKGCQLFNVLNISDAIDFVADEVQVAYDSKYIPGCGIEVINPSINYKPDVDYVLISAPTHSAELVIKSKEYWPKAKILITAPWFGLVENEYL